MREEDSSKDKRRCTYPVPRTGSGAVVNAIAPAAIEARTAGRITLRMSAISWFVPPMASLCLYASLPGIKAMQLLVVGRGAFLFSNLSKPLKNGFGVTFVLPHGAIFRKTRKMRTQQEVVVLYYYGQHLS